MRVAGGELLLLALRSTAPNRTHGVDHEACRQVESLRDAHLTGGAAARVEPRASLEQARPGGAVDRAVDSAAAAQRGVGRVDDRVGRLERDVAAHAGHAIQSGRGHGRVIAWADCAAKPFEATRSCAAPWAPRGSPMSSRTRSRTWRALQLPLGVGEPEALLRERAAHKLGFDPGQLRGFRIARKSLDARRRTGQGLRFVCNVDLIVDARLRPAALNRALRAGRALETPPAGSLEVEDRHAGFEGADPVCVVGAGPAGLFAAHVLACNGVRVHLIERGPAVEERGRALSGFHRTRTPDPEANLLFGEGGAGTYSDGKIYTRVDDPLEVPLLEELVRCGAPANIVYDSLAHIGTDRLHKILPAMRAGLIERGVRFSFDTRMESLVIEHGDPARVRALRTSQGELPCAALVLAVGHSARDTWSTLSEHGLRFEPRPFQLGLRIEHPQELIDAGRYGGCAEAELLGAAAYNLVSRRRGDAPAAHSFCMCPGGSMVASVSEAGLLCTNGMSNSRHSSHWASAALVTTLAPEHFGATASDPFAGVRFQRELEARFFEAGGGDYTAPAQAAVDFLGGTESRDLRPSTWTFGTRPARLDRLLPERVRVSLACALASFERAIPGFAGPEGQMIGVESRSSSPVRMLRDTGTRQATGFCNLYPVGEGAGWAGGIMSAALDGANAARSLLALGPARSQ